MSDLRRSNRSQAKLLPMDEGESHVQGLRRRWPFYAAAALLTVLVLAWFDGGEEPIHPISQQIILSEQS